jgi:hypothetical protein
VAPQTAKIAAIAPAGLSQHGTRRHCQQSRVEHTRHRVRRSKAGLKDVDEIWRGPGLRLWEVLLAALAAVASRVTTWGARALAGARSRVGPGTVGASLARGWTVRTMVLWVVVALAGMLVLSYR